MNYLLKRHSSPGGIVEYLVNHTKLISSRYCVCGNCLRCHPAFRNNVPKCSSSTFISPLELEVDKRKRTETTEKKQHLVKLGSVSNLLKVPSNKSSKKMGRQKLVESNGYPGASNHVPLGQKELHCNAAADESSDSHDRKTQEYMHMCRNFEKFTTSHRRHRNFKAVDFRPSRVVSFQGQRELFENDEIDREGQTNLEDCKRSAASETNQYESFPDGKFDNFTFMVDRLYTSLGYLYSSIDICLTNGLVKEAFELLQIHRRRNFWTRVTHCNKHILDIYNQLLEALSAKGYWYIMRTVVDWMKEDNINLDCRSFASLLQCLVKNKGSEQFVLREVNNVLHLIFVNNVSLNDVFSKTTLPKEDTDKILKVLRTIIPSFEIQQDVIELSSDCPLLKNLHAKPKEMQPHLEGCRIPDLDALVEEQFLLEKNFYLDVKAVSRGRPGEAPFQNIRKLENLKIQWRDQLTKAVKALLKVQKIEYPKNRESFNLYLYLNSLPVSKFVDILMETTQTLVEYSGGYSPGVDKFQKILARKIFQCYQLRKKDMTGFTDKTEKLYRAYMNWYENPTGPAMNYRQKWQMLVQESEESGLVDVPVVKWPEEVLDKLGRLFVNLILKEVTFTFRSNAGFRVVPVFYTALRLRGNVYREEIKCHPIVAKLFDSVGFDVLHFHSEEIPMVCPPKPWKSASHGGYLFLSTEFVRRRPGLHGKTIDLNQVPVKQLYATFDSLNVLQSVPWMINEDVLDVALQVFVNGGSKKLNVPLMPDGPPENEKLPPDLSYAERRKLYQKRNELMRDYSNNYSLWCETLYRLSLANHFRKRVFWMPQNCDFRGRVYPVPPLINHLGADLFRSFFVFAKGKPLGPTGLDWLKIHIINLTGTHKKRSTKERLEYANEILPEILDSAENPLNGAKWWTESDEPWQTLAGCIELKKVLSSPNPETYICRFPIHQDGSCNGLQHYAALGKDLVGAQSVNLTPCDKPQDVYSVVAGLVEQERSKDAANGVEIAKVLEDVVERKIVKQTVMTTVYGVTAYGARLQIVKRLEEVPNFPREYIVPSAAYLTDKTFLCLKKMFTSAKEIQEWFINCAGEICRMNDYVQWYSPLGLPVLQSYSKYRMNLKTRERELRPDSVKQKNAFPPNFIHSLDSCHMMLTSLYSEHAGITFAAIHDCFWTHPSTVDRLNRICREQFISLHSQAILEDLSIFFKAVYGGCGLRDETKKIFESVPDKGDFDIGKVMNSVYFFS